MPTSKKPSQRPRHSIPATSSSPSTSSRSPLPKTPWNGPWQRRQTTRTTRPCQTLRLSPRSSTCRRLRRLHARCRTWSAASHCAWCAALDRVDVSQKKLPPAPCHIVDDTKLAQSCTHYVQHWYTVVPDPAMRVTLWALMGAGGNCHE